ncbi:hypothetical protein PIROE2DRAFT_19067, partial [Piromyces sp. E2]
FNVVSINGEGSLLGVKYGDVVVPLTATNFPLFSGQVEADNITNYKYVVLDEAGAVIEEESINRTYSEQTAKINEVYNRTTKDHEIPELPQPFNSMFPFGNDDFKPFQKDTIFNVYAKCDPVVYNNLVAEPFIGGTHEQNNVPANCTITIVSPKKVFTSEGSIHIIGFGSRQYKRLSWNMRFEKKFKGRRSIKLRGIAGDPTLIRENLATALYKSVGVPVQEGTYCRLFINGDTYGLYSLLDSFGKKWIAGYIHGDMKAKTGFSYRIYATYPHYADFRYIGDDYHLYNEFFMPDEYDDEDIDPDQEATKYPPLISLFKRFNDWVNMPGQPVEELAKFLNIEVILRLMVIDTLTIGQDNFLLRISNASVYYNALKDKYFIVPYDFDKTLRDGSDEMLTPDYMSDCFTWAYQYEDKIDHFFTKTLLDHPEIKKRYDVILAKTTKELFNSQVISSYTNAIADLIREDVQWNFDTLNDLSIPYQGVVNHYTYEQFEGNLGTEHVEESAEIEDAANVGLMEIVQLRGDNCRAATETVDISNNENISDKEIVPVYKPVKKSEDGDEEHLSGAIAFLPTIKSTVYAILFIQLLFTFF